MGYELVEFNHHNMEPRQDLLLVVDTSSSMSGDIDEVNRGLQTLQAALQEDPLARKCVEVAVVTFGGMPVVRQSFVELARFEAPTLSTQGATPMGAALMQSLDLVDAHGALLREVGIPRRSRPWVFLITDGQPTDGDSWRAARDRIHRAERAKELVFFAVGTETADFSVLDKLGPRGAKKLRDQRWHELFLWVIDSMRSISRSAIGEQVPLLPTRGDDGSGWEAV